MLDRPKVKNTKAYRKAKRKAARSAGWTEAKNATKDLLVGTTMRDLEAGAKAAKEGKPGMDFVNFTTQTVRNAVNEIPTNIKNVGKLFKGIAKGIFNHPSWYEYKGTLSTPAHNILRPFSPVTLKPVAKKGWSSGRSSQYAADGTGVTHYVNVAIRFNDMRATESFKLATIEAFRAIRLDLKSNLPYSQEAYDNYITMATSILIKAKAIEKLLGMYNYTRPDIPEFSRAQKTVAINPTEQGIVTPTEIHMISEGMYATTLNDFKKLKSILNNIAIPRKLAEYVAWWAGSNFIDQAAPNPQIYSTILREALVFEADNNYDLSVKYSWDIATGTVQTVIDEAMDLLTKFGIMNADIVKTGRYGICNVILPEEYQPIFLNDPEFFSILINSYGINRNSAPLTGVFNPDYIRVDALEEVGPSHLVGMSNALSTWSGFSTMCEIISQSCYLQVDDSFDLPTAVNGIVTGNSRIYAVTVEGNGCWIQITGSYFTQMHIDLTHTAGNSTTLVTKDSRADATIVAATSSASVALSAAEFHTDRRENLIMFNYGYNSSNELVALAVIKGETSLKLYNVTTSTTIATLTYSGTIAWSGNTCTMTSGTANIANTYVATLKALIDANAVWYYGALNNTQYTVTYAVTAAVTANYRDEGNGVAAWFCELVDYHLPIILRETTYITDGGSNVGKIDRPYTLLKECYKPMIFNYADISTVLYWMYLALFSMD